MACHVAGQVERVLKPGGAVTWYDFRYNNPRNPRVQGMNKKRVQILFPQFELRLRTITLMPPLARRLGRLTLIIYPMLSKFVFLQSHYLGLLIKP